MRGRARRFVASAVLCAAAPVAAQPADPYTLPPAPAQQPAQPPQNPAQPAQPSQPGDPALAEQVAQSLVTRAQELFDARVFVDAKVLVEEALARSPNGPSSELARALLARIDKELGISATPPKQPEPAPDLTPIQDPTDKQRGAVDTGPELPMRPSRLTTGIHAGLYAGLLGATAGSFFSKDTPASGAVPVGIAAGLAAGLYAPRLFDRFAWNDGQIRTAGAGSVWGGVIGGFFADSVKTEDSTGREVLVGSAIGATLGAAGGVLLARRDAFSTGDIALVDTFAGIGAIGGLTMGMIMQPAETEAYSVNAMVGTTGGVIAGLVAAPMTNTTPRRMARVAGFSAAGGALPFLLYAGIRDGSSKADERLTGVLSSAGLLAGAWLGFRLTRNMDVGLDVLPANRRRLTDDDAPIALVGRHSDGRWAAGALTVQPLSRQLAPQRGMQVPLLGLAF